jgi:hypothetical protein
LTPERAFDLALGERSERHRLSAAIGIDDEEISHTRAVPDKRDALAVGRPDRSGGMSDVDQLLDSELRFVGGSAGLRIGAESQRHDRGGGSKIIIPFQHSFPLRTVASNYRISRGLRGEIDRTVVAGHIKRSLRAQWHPLCRIHITGLRINQTLSPLSVQLPSHRQLPEWPARPNSLLWPRVAHRTEKGGAEQ